MLLHYLEKVKAPKM